MSNAPETVSVTRETVRRAFNIFDSVIIAALLGVGALLVNLNNAVISLSADVKSLTNAQLAQQAALGELPNVRAKMAEFDVRIKRNAEDIAEIRDMRGLK